MLGIDPDCLLHGAAQKRADQPTRRAIAAGDIGSKRPADYLAWAAKRYPIPEVLAEAVRAFASHTKGDGGSRQHRDTTWLKVIVALAANTFPGKNPFSTAGPIARLCDQHGLSTSEDTICQLLKRAQELGIKPQ